MEEAWCYIVRYKVSRRRFDRPQRRVFRSFTDRQTWVSKTDAATPRERNNESCKEGKKINAVDVFISRDSETMAGDDGASFIHCSR